MDDIFTFWYWLLVLAALAAGAIVGWIGKDRKRQALQEREWQEQRCRHLQELEEVILEWLVMLGLPQLEEKTKRLAAARQLRTVLIVKLLRSPLPDCNPKT